MPFLQDRHLSFLASFKMIMLVMELDKPCGSQLPNVNDTLPEAHCFNLDVPVGFSPFDVGLSTILRTWKTTLEYMSERLQLNILHLDLICRQGTATLCPWLETEDETLRREQMLADFGFKEISKLKVSQGLSVHRIWSRYPGSQAISQRALNEEVEEILEPIMLGNTRLSQATDDIPSQVCSTTNLR